MPFLAFYLYLEALTALALLLSPKRNPPMLILQNPMTLAEELAELSLAFEEQGNKPMSERLIRLAAQVRRLELAQAQGLISHKS